MVIQYGLSETYDHVNGDPFMTSVPALTNYANDSIFPSPSDVYPSSNDVIYTLAITIKRSDSAGLRLNGIPLKVFLHAHYHTKCILREINLAIYDKAGCLSYLLTKWEII